MRAILIIAASLAAAISATSALAQTNALTKQQVAERFLDLERRTANGACAKVAPLPWPICRDDAKTDNLLQPSGRIPRVAYIAVCDARERACANGDIMSIVREYLTGGVNPDARVFLLFKDEPKTGRTLGVGFSLTLLPEAP